MDEEIYLPTYEEVMNKESSLPKYEETIKYNNCCLHLIIGTIFLLLLIALPVILAFLVDKK